MDFTQVPIKNGAQTNHLFFCDVFDADKQIVNCLLVFNCTLIQVNYSFIQRPVGLALVVLNCLQSKSTNLCTYAAGIEPFEKLINNQESHW